MSRRRSGTETTANALGRGLIILGDRWNLLILVETLAGTARFVEFKHRLAVSDPVLAGRLRDLVDAGLLYTTPYSSRPHRGQYLATTATSDLWAVLVAAFVWEQRWTPPSPERLVGRLTHSCGNDVAVPAFGCASCGATGVDHLQTRAERRPRSTFAQSNPVRPYRRAAISGDRADRGVISSIVDVLGDRWTMSVIGAGMLAIRRFGQMRREIEASPNLLTDRLDELVAAGVLRRAPVKDGGRREEYRLQPKGLDLLPVMVCINDWSNRWLPDRGGPALSVCHERAGELVPSGHRLEPTWWCEHCGVELAAGAVRIER